MNAEHEPTYLSLYRSGELARRAESLWNKLSRCCLCPNECRANRTKGEKGSCGVAAEIIVSSVAPHYGEEPELVGRKGSGTIFFAGCNVHCLYCQNYTISQLIQGQKCSIEQLAGLIISLQNAGCANVNFVTPTPWIPHILRALVLAAKAGLKLPLVYNTGGYDSVKTLRQLSGIVDIYMPDMKYADPKIGRDLSGVRDYPKVNQTAVSEMHHQVGDLQVDDDGLAYQGLLVRHLVLPDDLAGSREIFHFLASRISKSTYVNVMPQYRPCYNAFENATLRQGLTNEEFKTAVQLARKAGLKRP